MGYILYVQNHTLACQKIQRKEFCLWFLNLHVKFLFDNWQLKKLQNTNNALRAVFTHFLFFCPEKPVFVGKEGRPLATVIPDGLEHPVLCPGVLHLVLRQDEVLLQDLHGVEALQNSP
jgi:hypothetical protein